MAPHHIARHREDHFIGANLINGENFNGVKQFLGHLKMQIRTGAKIHRFSITNQKKFMADRKTLFAPGAVHATTP